ncbi:SIR2 family protein [Vibrio alginolyticus]|uniref:SIR2 family protein n=1 Tax=Vibrio alginolyticus TaxID=663 RepID=UPI001BD5FB62|nr:SIR2 family protein [Vibrio alginolyticus]MBT0074521.1 SIR2 family protein [Vibrio alginolyticus]
MNIREFISQYRNHPVLFVGAGLSLRYLNNAFTWDGLLKHIAFELKGNNEFYLDIKADSRENGKYDYTKVATKLEQEFNADLGKNRDGKFKEINDIFYREMEKENFLSRFKIYISQLVSELDYKEDKRDELAELKKIRKNIGSVITTNYDSLIEDVFGFEPLVGNDILLSNPYGSVYKIHGCCIDPSKVIITEDDYSHFNDKYELIRAQLLSIFIHNPIIFMGYGIGDENIKSLLKTIFTYVEFNSEDAEKIRNNFLLVEYEQDSQSHEITEHDIDLEGFSTIRINKLKTDDFNEIYKSLSSLSLPVSAMDIRKVQSIVKDIYSGASDDGTSIKVNITEDIDSLSNSDKILVIGSSKSITYEHKNSASFMTDYFDIIDESNNQLIKLIDSISLAHNQWFPVYAFSDICAELQKAGVLKRQQVGKIENHLASLPNSVKTNHSDVQAIYDDATVTATRKIDAIMWSIWNDKIPADDVKHVLLGMPDKKGTDYRRLLCTYDYKKYS